MAAALPFVAAGLQIFGGIRAEKQKEEQFEREQAEKERAARENAERTKLETEEELRRKKIEDERTLAGMKARNAASGASRGSGQDYIRGIEEEMTLEADWIQRSGKWRERDYERTADAASGSSFTGDYITPFVRGAQWFVK